MALNPINPMPATGLIPSARTLATSPAAGVQTSGANPQGAAPAPARAGNSLSSEQYQTLRAQIKGLPNASPAEKLVLYKVIDDLDAMALSDNTPLAPEQRSVIEATVRNASDNVKAFAAQIMDSFNPAPLDVNGAAQQSDGEGAAVVNYVPGKPKSLFERIAAALTMLFTGQGGGQSQGVMTPISDQNQTTNRSSASMNPLDDRATFNQNNAPVNTDASSNYPLPTGDFYEKSAHHDPNKFVPRFPMIAYHESGVMRNEGDPYAVGAISNPSRGEDLGGKTYGVYQFESSTYADGSTSRDSSQSTLARFINSPNNPYGEQLRAAAQTHGLGSAGFDQVWKQLANSDNKAFGEAQESFMLQETEGKAADFFERAGLSEEIRNDPAMRDLVLGTINQVGNLATSAADHLKSVASSRGRPLTAAEASQALIEFKKDNIPNWFQSSPDAQQGVRNRYDAELVAMNYEYRSQDTGTMMA